MSGWIRLSNKRVVLGGWQISHLSGVDLLSTEEKKKFTTIDSYRIFCIVFLYPVIFGEDDILFNRLMNPLISITNQQSEMLVSRFIHSHLLPTPLQGYWLREVPREKLENIICGVKTQMMVCLLDSQPESEDSQR